jgi:hypothetical protein
VEDLRDQTDKECLSQIGIEGNLQSFTSQKIAEGNYAE